MTMAAGGSTARSHLRPHTAHGMARGSRDFARPPLVAPTRSDNCSKPATGLQSRFYQASADEIPSRNASS
jgi:hypothetical protein